MIERSRTIKLPSQLKGLEDHLARDIAALELPEPVRELHFMWCCEHGKVEHKSYGESHICRSCDGRKDLAPNHAYAHVRAWRFDFAWPAWKLAAEVDGGTFVQGAHTRGAHFESDAEKGNEAILRGWRVMHFTKHQIEDGRAVAWLEAFFKAHPFPPI